jgi:hypothetical protein
MAHNIVLIHIGEIFYPYINECINQIKKYSNDEIFLLTSSDHFSLIKSDITLISLESLKKSKKHELFIKYNKLNNKFRDGFWRFASERFFYLEEIVIKFDLKNVFHFENDVLIYNEIQLIEHILLQNNIAAAATFDNDERCIPGYVFFSDHYLLSELTEYFLKINSNQNDMELLSNFSRINKKFKHFPVIPDFYTDNLISKNGKTSNFEYKYSEGYKLFNSIFDAAALGQFLGGVDPRNGNIKSHFINESAIYQVSNFQFKWIKDDKGRNCPFAIYKGKVIKINNLHIHSKRLIDFI